MKDMKTILLSDEHFSAAMEQTVLPFLMTIRKQDYLPLTPGKRLYYEAYCPDDATGTIVISHGFCESAEKYKEVIYYFVKMGFQVFIADHRGHGRSHRDTTHPCMVHVHSFQDYVSDLHLFVEQIVRPASGELPLYLFAHSMGGGIGALYLETWPDTFVKAILTSPMLGINMGPCPACAAQLLGFVMVKLKRGETFAPGQHAFVPDEKWEDSGSSCRERFQYYQQKKEANPLFQNSGSSYEWAYQSLRSCHRITQKRNCDKITVPVLVFQSLEDSFVKASAIQRFVRNTRRVRLIPVSGCRHEIYNSQSAVLENYYNEIYQFLIS